jgi:hypothetical protein
MVSNTPTAPSRKGLRASTFGLAHSTHALNVRSETNDITLGRLPSLGFCEKRQQILPLIPIGGVLAKLVPAFLVDFPQSTDFVTERFLFTVALLLLFT